MVLLQTFPQCPLQTARWGPVEGAPARSSLGGTPICPPTTPLSLLGLGVLQGYPSAVPEVGPGDHDSLKAGWVAQEGAARGQLQVSCRNSSFGRKGIYFHVRGRPEELSQVSSSGTRALLQSWWGRQLQSAELWGPGLGGNPGQQAHSPVRGLREQGQRTCHRCACVCACTH